MMKFKVCITYIGMAVLLVFLACSNSEVTDRSDEDNFVPQKKESINGVRIGWDYSSIVQMAPAGGYPRSICLQDGSIMAVYENYDNETFSLRRSFDKGENWEEPVVIFDSFDVQTDKGTVHIHIANPEIIQLSSGELLVACNYRPIVDGIAPFSIAIRRSTDNGASWSESQIIYSAQSSFRDGCWEPSFLELPNGDIQVYFANEALYTHSDEQQISMLTSCDKGLTWSNFTTVSYRENSRDGMPVSKIVGNEIVCVIEDCGFTTFKPYTVRTSLSDNWKVPVYADSPNRCMALAFPIEDWIYMGAPYLAVFPTGESLLSYQVDDKRRDGQFGDRVPYSVMEVCVSDKDARNFTKATRPFPVLKDKHAIWPSVAVWDAHTVAAMASANFQGGKEAPCLIKGYVMRDIQVTETSPELPSIFIGHNGNSNLKGFLYRAAGQLKLDCEVYDNELYSSQEGKGSGVFVFLDTQNAAWAEPTEDVYKIWCAYNGQIKVWRGSKGIWVETDDYNVKSSVKVSDDGYQMSISLPVLSSFNQKEMRLGAALSTKVYIENLANMEDSKPYSWLRLSM